MVTDHLKKRAKKLLKLVIAEDPHACARVRACYGSRLADSTDDDMAGHVRLSHCQRTIAIELGYSAWPDLVHAPEAAIREAIRVYREAHDGGP